MLNAAVMIQWTVIREYSKASGFFWGLAVTEPSEVEGNGF